MYKHGIFTQKLCEYDICVVRAKSSNTMKVR